MYDYVRFLGFCVPVLILASICNSVVPNIYFVYIPMTLGEFGSRMNTKRGCARRAVYTELNSVQSPNSIISARQSLFNADAVKCH